VQLTPLPGATGPDAHLVRHSIATLAGRGFGEVITAALGSAEQQPFLAAGFTVREELHLLVHDLDPPPAPPDGAATLRRPHRREWENMGAIDASAFSPFWHLDAVGIAEASDATPSARIRVAVTAGSELAGYAVSGRSAGRGYLQRVAVYPRVQGRGFGTSLVVDGLRWMARRGAARALVNTQLPNERALALYLRLGFRLQSERLAVLTHPLAPAP
jgi:ribosomal protein S18 acetylase RimI-like enzyme